MLQHPAWVCHDGGIRLLKKVLTKKAGFSTNLQKYNFVTELDAEVHSINYYLDESYFGKSD